MVRLHAGGFPGLLVTITSKCCIQRSCIGSLKSTIVESLTLYGNWELANTSNQGCFCFVFVLRAGYKAFSSMLLSMELTSVFTNHLIVSKSLSLTSDKLEVQLLAYLFSIYVTLSKLLHLSKSVLLSKITHVKPLPQESTKQHQAFLQ